MLVDVEHGDLAFLYVAHLAVTIYPARDRDGCSLERAGRRPPSQSKSWPYVSQIARVSVARPVQVLYRVNATIALRRHR